MTKLIFLFMILITACSTQKITKNQAPRIEVNDSTQYELLVFDNEFESWYAMKNSPASSRSKDYYHNWNIQYIHAWNNRVSTSRNSNIYGGTIDYHANEDYPVEIEHKLFYYFQYVEQVLKIPLLPNSPRAI